MNNKTRRSLGSVKKISERTFKLTVTTGYDSKGNQIRKSKTVHVPSDRRADEELQKFLRECPFNTAAHCPVNSSTTLRVFVEYWQKQHAEVNNEEKTRERDTEILTKRILPALGHLKLCELTAPIIQKFLNSLKQPGMRLDGKPGFLSDRTIEMHYSVLHKILNKAVRWEILDKNRCDNVEVPRPKYKKVDVFDEPDMADFLSLVDNLSDHEFKYRVITHLAFSLGMRREEICGLTWRQIDFNSATLEVSQALTYIVGKPLYVKDTKNESSYRMLGLTGEIIELLRTQQANQKAAFAKENLAWSDSCFVFTQRKSTKPLHLNSYNTWLAKFLPISGLPHSSIHRLRHAFGTYQLAEGTDLGAIKDAMGHADLRTTSIYVNSLDSRKRLVAKASETSLQRLRDIKLTADSQKE